METESLCRQLLRPRHRPITPPPTPEKCFDASSFSFQKVPEARPDEPVRLTDEDDPPKSTAKFSSARAEVDPVPPATGPILHHVEDALPWKNGAASAAVVRLLP